MSEKQVAFAESAGSEAGDAIPRAPGDYRPLADPVRLVGLMLSVPLSFMTVLLVGYLCYLIRADGLNRDVLELWGLRAFLVGAWIPLGWCVWRIIPKRRVNAFYLRSFSGDEESAPIRIALQAALGRRFRLSGIRAPRKRWPWVVRFFHITLFALHYSTTRHMNLEAGPDWKQRLRRSFERARCAVIDLTELTPFVIEEIRLAIRSLGLERVLFVGRPNLSPDEWRDEIMDVAGPLSAEDPAKIRVAIWDDSREGRRAFAADVRNFAESLPKGVAGPPPEGAETEGGAVLIRPSPETAGGLPELVLGMVLGAMLFGAFRYFLPSALAPLWMLFLFALGVIELLTFAQYLIDCGFHRERILTITTITVALGCTVGLTGLAIGKVRDAADRVVNLNNLKQIGSALQDHESAHGALPPAGSLSSLRGAKLPAVSWRVRILPYLGHNDIFEQYKMNEPWDSPDNLKLLPRMPRVYDLPGKAEQEPGHTYYRVFVSPEGQLLRAAFETNRGVSRTAIRDGPSRTVLVVEAGESVPWTKPEALVLDTRKPLPPLGGRGREGFAAVLGDGSVRSFPKRPGGEVLRALITRNGDEPIVDP